MKKTTQTSKFTSINNQPNPTPASSETKKHLSGFSSVAFSMGKQVRIVSLLLIALFMFSTKGWGQTTFSWRGEATNGNWNDGNNWWNGSSVSTAGYGIQFFDNNNQLSMTNNFTGPFSTHGMRFTNS
jgi:hypothetical protein